MKLDIFNKLTNDSKENNLVENFIKELTKSIEKTKENNNTTSNINNEIDNENTPERQETLEQQETPEKETIEQQELEQNREENCLYQVVDFSAKGVYLLNKNTNKIFEETEIPQELKNQIQNDSILRYKNGEYVYEEELTEEFFNNLEDIDQ